MISNEKILKRIAASVIEVGDCLEWQRRMINGCPTMGVGQNRTAMVRRVLHEIHHGKIPSGKFPVMKCQNQLCVNVEHMILRTRVQIGKDSAKRGVYSTAERRIAVTRGAQSRATSKLDWEKVRAIRSAPSGAAAAREHGIHKSMANRIRRGDAWVETASASSVFTWRP